MGLADDCAATQPSTHPHVSRAVAGPIRRVPSGLASYYGRLPPLQGFSMAAAHGVVFALAGALIWKYTYGNPAIKKIEDYYKENPPR